MGIGWLGVFHTGGVKEKEKKKNQKTIAKLATVSKLNRFPHKENLLVVLQLGIFTLYELLRREEISTSSGRFLLGLKFSQNRSVNC